MPATITAVPVPAVLATPRTTATRLDRATAAAIDLAWGAAAALCAIALAFAWLLVRTGWGAVGVGEGDSILAAALIGAAVPVWLAWLALGLWWDGATPGQGSRGLRVRPLDPGRRGTHLLRLAMHPVAIPGWLWLAALAWIVALPVVPPVLAAFAAVLALLGLVSAGMVLRDPSARAVHDRIAGTRLVRSEGPDA